MRGTYQLLCKGILFLGVDQHQTRNSRQTFCVALGLMPHISLGRGCELTCFTSPSSVLSRRSWKATSATVLLWSLDWNLAFTSETSEKKNNTGKVTLYSFTH